MTVHTAEFPVRGCASSLSNLVTARPVENRLHEPLAKRIAIFTYGVVSYAVFFGTFLYAYGFVANIGTPTALDRLPASSTPSLPVALAINLGLLLLFAVQHSVMARPWFKAAWTRFVPEPAERSTYVLFSSIALIALFILWQPMGGMIWHVEEPAARIALYSVMGMGWLLVLFATTLINHFDLFGLRQVWLCLINQRYTHLPFKTPSLYRVVRHPLYVGWLIAFWATPTMTVAHLVFALVTTIYILKAISWEERDLVELHGHRYVEYRRRVPMLIPSVATNRPIGERGDA